MHAGLAASAAPVLGGSEGEQAPLLLLLCSFPLLLVLRLGLLAAVVAAGEGSSPAASAS